MFFGDYMDIIFCKYLGLFAPKRKQGFGTFYQNIFGFQTQAKADKWMGIDTLVLQTKFNFVLTSFQRVTFWHKCMCVFLATIWEWPEKKIQRPATLSKFFLSKNGMVFVWLKSLKKKIILMLPQCMSLGRYCPVWHSFDLERPSDQAQGRLLLASMRTRAWCGWELPKNKDGIPKNQNVFCQFWNSSKGWKMNGKINTCSEDKVQVSIYCTA